MRKDDRTSIGVSVGWVGVCFVSLIDWSVLIELLLVLIGLLIQTMGS
jgi:hypothetical protein